MGTKVFVSRFKLWIVVFSAIGILGSPCSLAMLVPTPGIWMGQGLPSDKAALTHTSRRVARLGVGDAYPASTRECHIDFPRKWKWFSTSSARQVPDIGQLMRNRLGLHLSTFGNPIAKESARSEERRVGKE